MRLCLLVPCSASLPAAKVCIVLAGNPRARFYSERGHLCLSVGQKKVVIVLHGDTKVQMIALLLLAETWIHRCLSPDLGPSYLPYEHVNRHSAALKACGLYQVSASDESL